MRLHQPLDDALASVSHVRVLRTLFMMPLRIHVSGRELARRAGLSHPTATKVLNDLAYQGVVRVQRQVGAEGYVLNPASLLAGPLEELFRAEAAIPSRFRDAAAHALAPYPQITAAYVFGSAARRQMRKDSDIDLAILAPGADADALGELLEEPIDGLRRIAGSPVQLVVANVEPARMRTGRRRLWARIEAEGMPVPIPRRRRRAAAKRS